MQNDEMGRTGGGEKEVSSSKSGKGEEEGSKANGTAQEEEAEKEVGGDPSTIPSPGISIEISQPEDGAGLGKTDDRFAAYATVTIPSSPKKGFLQRNESYHEVCRVCQQQSEEALMDLGCRCRGDLAKAHRSCIDIWFHSRGSNKCEICQQVAANVPSPDSLPSMLQPPLTSVTLQRFSKDSLSNYWMWRVDAASGNSAAGRRQRGCCSPLWVAFSILIGGLLLDVLISVSLGVSALPVNIIIGILIVFGLGTAFRLTFECCHDWSLRRNFQMTDTAVNPGYPPAV